MSISKTANAPRRTRRIAWGSFEHQQRETYARHVHADGAVTYFGDGEHVLAVCHRPKKGQPWCEVIGEAGVNVWGDDFHYANYFLPEELGVASSDSETPQ